MDKPEINMPYIRKVLAHIEGDLKRLNMRGYYYFKPEGIWEEYEKEWPACGTKACFAGWGYFLSLPQGAILKDFEGRLRGTEVRDKAAKLFGFTNTEASRIFEGEACNPFAAELQLEILKEELNKLFESRGLSERV